MANAMFNRGLLTLANFDWAADATDMGVMLMKSTYVFDNSAHNTVADAISGSKEATGSGYLRKAIVGANRSTIEDDSANEAELKVSDGTVVFTSISAGTGLEVILFFVDGGSLTGSDTHNLCGHIDTGTNIPINTNGGNVTLNFSATEGAIKLT